MTTAHHSIRHARAELVRILQPPLPFEPCVELLQIVLREQNDLPYETWIAENLTAKDDVDNVGAGRAAKGENPGRSFFAIPSLRSLLLDQKNAGNRLNFLHFLFVFQFPFLCMKHNKS